MFSIWQKCFEHFFFFCFLTISIFSSMTFDLFFFLYCLFTIEFWKADLFPFWKNVIWCAYSYSCMYLFTQVIFKATEPKSIIQILRSCIALDCDWCHMTCFLDFMNSKSNVFPRVIVGKIKQCRNRTQCKLLQSVIKLLDKKYRIHRKKVF